MTPAPAGAPGSDAIRIGICRHVAAHPLDRAPQPLVQRHRGVPAKLAARARGIGAESTYFTRLGPISQRLVHHGRRTACERLNAGGEIADRDFLTGSEVVNIADGTGLLARMHKP